MFAKQSLYNQCALRLGSLQLPLMLLVLAAGAMPTVVLAEESSAPSEMAARPNVVWILLDACRAENLGCYGHDRPASPTMDALASRGVLFENHFAQASKTYQSVPSYMTGKYFPLPCFSKRFSQSIFSATPPEDEKMLGEIFRENGYVSAMFSNMPLFLDTDRLSRSFDEVHLWKQGEHILLQRWVVMNNTLHAWLTSPREKPFFLYIHAADTHFPHEMTPPFDQWIDPAYDPNVLLSMGFGQNYMRRDGAPFDSDDRDYFNALYDGMILDADTQINLVMETLKRQDLLDNTLLIISADHGQLLGEDGYVVAHHGDSDQVLHIPLIMAGPNIPVGRRIQAQTENVDIVPTLVEMLHLNTTARFDGRSMTPLLRDAAPGEFRDYLFAVPDRLDYERPTGFSLRGREAKFHFSASGVFEKALLVPDAYGAAKDITTLHAQNAPPLENRIKNEFLPRLQRLQEHPIEAIVLEGAWLANTAQPRDLVVDYYLSGESSTKELEEDNKWAFTDGFLWVRNDQETAPKLSFEFTVPNGCYDVFIYMLNSLNHDRLPASAVTIHFEGEESPRQIVHSSLPSQTQKVAATPLGNIAITQGKLAFQLSAGPASFWTMIHSIELYPCGARQEAPDNNAAPTAVPAEDASEYHEIMRGLGYM